LDVQAGIRVTVIGMGLVFSALAVLMLAIICLNRVFRPKKETAPEPRQNAQGSDEETIAALAVALSLALEQHEPRPAEPVTVLSIRRGPGAWKAHARLRSTE